MKETQTFATIAPFFLLPDFSRNTLPCRYTLPELRNRKLHLLEEGIDLREMKAGDIVRRMHVITKANPCHQLR
jgi:hypothetical protein